MPGPLINEPDQCHPGEQNTCDHYDIKQFFHLDEQGNILLNMAHIVECQALGLCLQSQSRRLYRRYRRGCECADEDFCQSRGCCRILRRLLRLLCELIAGKEGSPIAKETLGSLILGSLTDNRLYVNPCYLDSFYKYLPLLYIC